MYEHMSSLKFFIRSQGGREVHYQTKKPLDVIFCLSAPQLDLPATCEWIRGWFERCGVGDNICDCDRPIAFKKMVWDDVFFTLKIRLFGGVERWGEGRWKAIIHLLSDLAWLTGYSYVCMVCADDASRHLRESKKRDDE